MRKVLGGAQPPRDRAMVRQRKLRKERGARKSLTRPYKPSDLIRRFIAVLPPSSSRSGGLPGRRSSPQQTTDFHRTMAKVRKSGGEGTFAERHGNGEVAPIPAIRGTAIEPRGSTHTFNGTLIDYHVGNVEDARCIVTPSASISFATRTDWSPWQGRKRRRRTTPCHGGLLQRREGDDGEHVGGPSPVFLSKFA